MTMGDSLPATAERRRDTILRAIFESAAVGIVLVDAEGVILRANRAFEEILGYGAGGVLGRHVQQLTHPDDAESSGRNIALLREGKLADYREEKRYVRRDGSAIWARISVAAVPPTAGTAAFAVGIIEDITERRRAEAELGQQNRDLERLANQLRAVLDSALDGILLADRDGNI